MNDIEESHRSLRLLEEISSGDELTQRDLSDRAGMALGLVNAYLKNLVAKGYIKISAIPPKRFRYYVTPKGFVEKSRLTYHLLQNYTRIFREARRDYSALFHRLHAQGVSGVYFAGVDEVAEIAYLSLQEVDVEFLGAVDTGRRGESFFKTRILGFDELEGLSPGARVVITTYNRRDAVYRRLAEAGVDMGLVHSIYPLTGGRKAG
ncbi:MAG: winged helix-turn-helix transcriptional regulator [Nitrospirae bacterium]|nr:winged helix-turn-helix transcriptional regulator [Nitrospirota bacterium]MBI5696859.1 winged helix-turn-helix transcriptional regulator [Nitrospirota bacterium]